MYFVYLATCLLPLWGAFLLWRNRSWRPLAPFAIALMVMSYYVGLAGLGRYSASCWPAFLPLASALQPRPRAWRTLLIACAVGQIVLMCLFAHGFPLT